MKGFTRFMRDAWWVFVAAAVLTVVMAQVTGWVLYYAFLPVLGLVALYMSSVRYDSQGNERLPQPAPRRPRPVAQQSDPPPDAS